MIDQIITLLYSALFFVTPLIMTKSTSELFEFNKMIFIYATTVLITFFWLLKMVVNRKIILKKTFLDIPILIFFLSQLISTFFSIDRHTSIFGYYGRFNGGLLSIVCYLLLYYGLVSNIVSIKKLLKTIIASSLLVIVWAIPGHFGRDLTCLLFSGQLNNSCWDNTTLAFRPELRAFSTLGQPNWLGAYLAVAFFIGIYFLLENQILNIKYQKYISNIKNIIWPVYLFLNFSMILMSRSRSAIGAVIVGLILFVSYYFFFIKSNFKKILIILLVATILPIIFFKTGEDKIDKFLTLSTHKNIFTVKRAVSLVPNRLVPNPSLNVTESFDIRKIVWEGAWKLALRYPLFGTGVETFAYSYYFVRPIAHNLTSEWDYVYNKAHNEYFNYLATTGFVGFGSYLIFIGVFTFYITKKIKDQRSKIKTTDQKSKISKNLKSLGLDLSFNILTLSLFCGWITILITNFFGFSTTTAQLFFFLIPAFFLSSFDSLVPNPYSLVPNYLTNLQKLLIFLLLASAIYLLFSISVYYLADVNYSFGLKYSKVNDQQKSAEFFEKALKLRAEPVYMDKFSSSLAYLSAAASIQNQNDLAKKIASVSDSYNRKNVQDYPKNVFYWKTRAKNMYYFFQVTGKENELRQGIEALKNAQKLSPTDPKIPYSLALYGSILFDVNNNYQDKQAWQKMSLEEINKTIELKSNFREGYLLKGQLLKKYGLNIEAKKVFEEMLKNFDKNDEEVQKELKDL
ncbi:MAG: tetratricopeptide repeat protein [uncultured bacterium]|nr:MAG: tetratricopeptide repeat protein [uncultured bacterium]